MLSGRLNSSNETEFALLVMNSLTFSVESFFIENGLAFGAISLIVSSV